MWLLNKLKAMLWRKQTAPKPNRAAELDETRLSQHRKEMKQAALRFLDQQQEDYRRRLENLDFKTELRQRRF